MAELSKTVITDEAIIIQRDSSNSRWAEDYAVQTTFLDSSYRKALLNDAQLIRSQRLKETGSLISTEQALIEANLKERDRIIYITTLQK